MHPPGHSKEPGAFPLSEDCRLGWVHVRNMECCCTHSAVAPFEGHTFFFVLTMFYTCTQGEGRHDLSINENPIAQAAFGLPFGLWESNGSLAFGLKSPGEYSRRSPALSVTCPQEEIVMD